MEKESAYKLAVLTLTNGGDKQSTHVKWYLSHYFFITELKISKICGLSVANSEYKVVSHMKKFHEIQPQLAAAILQDDEKIDAFKQKYGLTKTPGQCGFCSRIFGSDNKGSFQFGHFTKHIRKCRANQLAVNVPNNVGERSSLFETIENPSEVIEIVPSPTTTTMNSGPPAIIKRECSVMLNSNVGSTVQSSIPAFEEPLIELSLVASTQTDFPFADFEDHKKVKA